MAATTNYGWTKPDPNSSAGVWGTMLNAIFDAVDAALFAASNVADGALPKTGGTLTGQVEVRTERYQLADLGNIAGAVEIDCALANAFYGAVTGAASITFANVPASGRWFGIVLELTNGGSAALTWPASVKWPGGVAPALQAAGVDILAMWTRDGGATWRAALSQGNSS